MNIGFDFDKIFINFPPLIPEKIIDLFYKERTNSELKYRIPTKLEQIVRINSHHPIFRSPIYENINFVKNLSQTGKDKYYIISSRFNFLKKRTDDFIKLHHFDKIFNSMHFNYGNKQPHQFKDEILKKLNLDMYVDDDLQLLEYLTDKNPKTNFFWLNKKIRKPLKKNLFAIKHLAEMLTPHNGA
jgi:hypothetical protein